MSKIKNWRWKCPYCKQEGWEVIEKQGVIPQHARPDNKDCQKWNEELKNNS